MFELNFQIEAALLMNYKVKSENDKLTSLLYKLIRCIKLIFYLALYVLTFKSLLHFHVR